MLAHAARFRGGMVLVTVDVGHPCTLLVPSTRRTVVGVVPSPEASRAMAQYMVSWKVNSSAWSTDPKEVLAALEGATGGGDQLLAGGAIKELGWFTPQEGYAIFEADAKANVLGMAQSFFPYFTQEIHEIVPWEAGKKAILESARQAASR